MIVKQAAQCRLELRQDRGAGLLQRSHTAVQQRGLQMDQGGAVQAPRLGRRRLHAGFGSQTITALQLERRLRQRHDAEVGQQACFHQQTQLECPQRRLRLRILIGMQLRQGLGVGIEEQRMGVLPGQQLEQQLVEVIARKQRSTGRQGAASGPFGGA